MNRHTLQYTLYCTTTFYVFDVCHTVVRHTIPNTPVLQFKVQILLYSVVLEDPRPVVPLLVSSTM